MIAIRQLDDDVVVSCTLRDCRSLDGIVMHLVRVALILEI